MMVALQAIIAVTPATATVLRGAFAGALARLELQFADVTDLQQVVEALACGLTHTASEPEAGSFTGALWVRHEWTGCVIDMPVMLWAYQMVDALPVVNVYVADQTQSLATRLLDLLPANRALIKVLAPHRSGDDRIRIG
jgi:hypothetical protein